MSFWRHVHIQYVVYLKWVLKFRTFMHAFKYMKGIFPFKINYLWTVSYSESACSLVFMYMRVNSWHGNIIIKQKQLYMQLSVYTNRMTWAHLCPPIDNFWIMRSSRRLLLRGRTPFIVECLYRWVEWAVSLVVRTME